MPRTVLLAGLVAVLAAFAAPAAHAQDTRTRILRECQDGALRGDYTIQEIRDARNNIPDDIDQYSDCRDVLARAMTATTGGGGSPTGGGGEGGAPTGGAGAGGGGGFGSGGGGDFGLGGGTGGGGGALLTPSTDEDRRALEEADRSGALPMTVDGREVVPGAAGLATGAARNALPITLLVVLGLLALAALAAVATAPAARRHALRPLVALGPALRRRVRRRPA